MLYQVRGWGQVDPRFFLSISHNQIVKKKMAESLLFFLHLQEGMIYLFCGRQRCQPKDFARISRSQRSESKIFLESRGADAT